MWLLMASHQNWLVETGLSTALPGPAESEGGGGPGSLVAEPQ